MPRVADGPVSTDVRRGPGSRRALRLAWPAAFGLGLIGGWILLGRLLLPAPPANAEPSQLSMGYQKLYLRLLADAFWWTQDADLVVRALGAWDREAVSSRLVQMEAEAADGEVRARLAALRAAVDVGAPPFTWSSFIRRHSVILVSMTLPLAMFLCAGGLSLAPYARNLWMSSLQTNEELDLEALRAAAQPLGAPPATSAGNAQMGTGAQGVAAAGQPAPGAARTGPSPTEPSPRPAHQALSAAVADSPDGAPAPSDVPPYETEPAAAGAPPSVRPNARTSGEVTVDGQGPASEQPAREPSAGPGTASQGQSPVAAVDAALDDSSLPGDLEALLSDDVFSAIFDVDVLFDPFLKSLSAGLEDVELSDLLRQARLVALSLYAASTVSGHDPHDVDQAQR